MARNGTDDGVVNEEEVEGKNKVSLSCYLEILGNCMKEADNSNECTKIYFNIKQATETKKKTVPLMQNQIKTKHNNFCYL